MPDLSKILRITGFESDSRGIMNRYIGVDGAWDIHLSNCRKYITGFLRERKIRNLAVYGSGWLLDFPLEEASELAEHIWLYDLVHPAQILHKIKKFRNVTTVKADITGGTLAAVFEAVQLYHKTGFKPDIPALCNRTFDPGMQYDGAVSLNILSQIGDLLTDYISQNIKLTPDEKDNIHQVLQQNHLKLLSTQPSCLITDTQEMTSDDQGRLTGTRQLIKCPLPGGTNICEWEWQFDPLKEYNPGFVTVSKVVGIEVVQ
jgi:hypothetical protein